MKYLRFKQIGVALLMMVLAISCIDDSEPTPMTYTAYGFLTNVGDTYYVDADGGMKLKLVSLDDTDLELTGNDRVLIRFTVEESYDELAPVDYLVNLAGLYLVDYSSILTLNETNRDTIGDGFVFLDYTPVAVDEYLNLPVLYQKQEGDHVFSLCYDEENQVEGKPVILELRNYYPKKKEGATTTYISYQSFNIAALAQWGQPNEDMEIEFTLRLNSGDSQERDYELTYAPMDK